MLIGSCYKHVTARRRRVVLHRREVPFAMRRALWTAGLLSLGLFFLYAAMACRDVMFGDGPELTAAAVMGGVAHPPGYPLWIVLGHLAAQLPIGPPAFRVNLTASLYQALAAGLVFASAFVLTRRIFAALFAALLLSLGSAL